MRAPAITLTILAVAGCSPHKVTHNPAPPVEVPASYGEGASTAPMPERWWRDFGDPQLNQLVESGIDGNLQVRAAWARLRQARALARQAGSARWPQVDLSASAARQEQRFNLPMIGEQTFASNSFTVSLGAGYEVDLWNKIGSAASAADLSALASRDNAEALVMTTVAQIAETWFRLTELRAEKKLLDEQLKVSETYLELTDFRFKQGLASALDVYQQQQQVTQLKSQLALVDSGLATLAHSLAVLVGKPPRTAVAEAGIELPELPPLPGTGLPVDLLERRPDVRAARRLVEARDYQVAVAIADRLPSLRLQGSLSLSDSNITELLATPLYSILGSVLAPLIDGGRRRAVVDQRRAELEEAVYNYGAVLLQAMTEVENALVQERQQRLHISELEAQVDVSGKALREARERYRQGLIDYLPVLTSLQTSQRAEIALLQARLQLITYRIQLCRALGGSWTRELEPPEQIKPTAGGDS
jgi:NodT family efflux transporter outer membrane factor (OMF) lipoprotein